MFDGAYDDTFRLPQDKERFTAHARELEAAGMPRWRHFLSNVRIRVGGDAATYHCFFQIVATEDDSYSTITMVGEYADQLVKMDGRWLFTKRSVAVDGPSATAH